MAFLIAFALASIALLYPLPDSPRYYYATSQEAKADKVLGRLCVGLSEKVVGALRTKMLSA